MARSGGSRRSGQETPADSQAASAPREIDPAEWRRAVLEVLVDADGPLSLRDIKRRAGEALDSPAPAALEDQMQSLLRLGHIEQVENEPLYKITDQGGWLVEGNRVLHSSP